MKAVCDELRGFARELRPGQNECPRKTIPLHAKLPRMRLVLDTNIMVSIYLYGDARHTPLRAAYAPKRTYAATVSTATLLMDAYCYEELAHVLRSRRFEKVRSETKADVDALLLTIADECEWIASAVPQGMPALPICRDPDDQKFLALAARGRGDALLSYDKALLKCRGRTRFAILRPEEFPRWQRANITQTQSTTFAA
jgi:uncharacterized protein